MEVIRVAQNYLFKLSLVLMGLIILAHLYFIFCYSTLSPDSGYYLKIASDLSSGLNFYGGINCSYTPLVLDFFSLPFYFDENVSVKVLYSIHVAQYLFIAIIFYKITAYFNNNSKARLFYTVLLISSLFIFEGIYILLEPLTLLFQLLAILFLMKSKENTKILVIVGILVFLSFYSKQYGAFIIPGILFFIYKSTLNLRQVIYKLILFGTGFIIPIVILSTYFWLERGLGIQIFLNQLFGLNALVGDDVVTGSGYSFRGLHMSLEHYIKFLPFIFFFIVFIPKIKKIKISTNSFFVLILLLSSYSVLKFAYYPHYFQFIAPYTVLLFACISNEIIKKNTLFFGALGIVFFVTNTKQTIKTYNKEKEESISQNLNTKIIGQLLKENTKVYLQGISPAHYFLNKFDSPNPKKLGYKFPEEMSPNFIVENLPKNSYIIANKHFVSEKGGTKLKVYKKFTIKTIDNKNKEVYLLRKQ